MTARTARRLVVGAWALSLALLAAAQVFYALLEDVAGPEDITVGFMATVSALTITYSAVGGVVAARRPANPVGWIFLGSALSASLILAAATYAETAVPVPPSGPVPGASLALFVSESFAFPTVALLGLVLLVYPDGRLLSRRWRVAGAIVAAAMVTSALGALAPGAIGESSARFDNPLAVGGTAGDVLDGLRSVAGVLLQLSLVLGAASMVVRYRRSRGDERLQLKWFVLTIACIAAFVAIAAVAAEVAPAQGGANPVEEACFYLALLGVAALPVASAIAILKYRLYDIDVVINRALVYGALTALLAGAYLGSVLLLQLVLSPGSDLAVAASTLAVAALFRPARTRVQAAVDRRFYRRRYDAANTLERFGGRLRAEVDLEALRADLALAVRETLQPAHVSLWLRSDR